MATIKNLKDLIMNFSDEKKCRDFLIQQRWNGSPICPYCKCEKWYSIEGGKRFKCGDKDCHKKYSVTVGTIFHSSNIPLTTWFPAVYLISAHKKGISSVQLSKDLGVSQKTSWFMLHRIRESLKNKGSFMLKNTVEVDEIYIGGKGKNISNKKRAELKESGNSGGYIKKTMVIGMVERGGDLRLQVAGSEAKANIYPIVYGNVDKSAYLMTDGEGSYINIAKSYAGHDSVNHGIHEYVREGIIHTNTIEGAFGMLRRCVIGTYHKLSPKHLSRYCDEISYRYNTRESKDGFRFESILGNIESPLSWKKLTEDNGFTPKATIEPEIPPIKVDGRGKALPVCQMLNGEIIGTYPSIIEASKTTGIPSYNISKAIRGVRNSSGGFQWKYR